MDEIEPRGSALASTAIVSGPLLLAGLGFGIGWFTTAPHIAGALQTIGMIVFTVATGVTAWLLRTSRPAAADMGFGAIYGAAAMAGLVCGGHAAACIHEDRESLASVFVIVPFIVIFLPMYALPFLPTSVSTNCAAG